MLAFGVVVAVLGISLVWMAERIIARERRVVASVAEAGRELGLRRDGTFLLSGECSGFRVVLTSSSPSVEGDLVVEDADRTLRKMPADLTIKGRSLLERHEGDSVVVTGDEPFDNAIQVQGRRDYVLGTLDEETRTLLEGAAAGDLRIEAGRIIRRGASVIRDGSTLVQAIRNLVSLAGRLSLGDDEIVARLARNARKDPWEGVRRRNVETLLDEYPSAPETQATLRALCQDPEPSLRLWAALRLGADGYETLAKLVASPESEEPLVLTGIRSPMQIPDTSFAADALISDASLALEALERLVLDLPAGRLWPVLDTALVHPSYWVRERALQATIALGGRPALERLAHVLADPAGDLATRAATAIGEAGDVSFEPALITALHTDSLALRTAAAAALGRVGTLAAVSPLRQVIQGGVVGVLTPAVRHAALDAIARIRSRHPQAAPGHVALASSDVADGHLTVADAESDGRVALSESQEDAG